MDVAGAKDYADLENWLEWNEAMGWQQTEIECRDAGDRIVCDYTYSNPWMDQEGIEPYGGGEYTLEVADGKITSVVERTDVAAFWPLWLEFVSWVNEKHPDAGILDGDLLAVNRRAQAENGEIVVARLEDEVTVKRFRRRGNVVRLLPENPDFEPIVVDLRRQDLVIEGIGVGVLRNRKPL